MYNDDKLTLYFHSAKEGRKISALLSDKNVCFEMDCEHRLIEGNIACEYGFSFKSIIGNGMVSFIEDKEEKIYSLGQIMKHQTGKEFTFDDKMVEAVCVFKIEVSSCSGKYHK